MNRHRQAPTVLPALSLHLNGFWQVQPVPLDQPFNPVELKSEWIDVPSCAHLQTVLYPDQPYWGDSLRAVNDCAWVYRQTFRVPDGTFRRARLSFEGVDYYAEVWVNGEAVGRHEGHFAPFDIDVTRFLEADTMTLMVVVSSPWDAPNPTGTYPSDHVVRGLVKGLYEHGEGVIPPNVNPLGIWRPVRLLLDHGISIDHVRIRTDLDGRVDLRVRTSNATGEMWRGNLELHIAAANHDGRGARATFDVVVPAGSHEADYTITVPDPHWWWCRDQGLPDLYEIDLCLRDDDGQLTCARRQPFGIRTVTLERTPERFTYRLNGRPVFIRGASYLPSVYLSQCSRELLAHDVMLAERAHLNLLRVHVHVSPPDLYDLCDRAGLMIWQDFELNWIQDSSAAFEERARAMQRDMIDLLGSHPSVITWACHNEPTMVFARRQNLERRPDPALYADAQVQDSTRPVFLCSGQMDDDWQRSGDSHSYYGSIWTPRYTDQYAHHTRLNTEFGFETPAAPDTLRAYPAVWERLKHLEDRIDSLWAYQAALIQFQVEHFRRLRAEGCAGYIQFWLVDAVPQVGCGVLDACRVPKGGYQALRFASRPLHVALEHDGHKPVALWVFNDTQDRHDGARLFWQACSEDGRTLEGGDMPVDVRANASQRVCDAVWDAIPCDCATVRLRLYSHDGKLLCENSYDEPFQPRRRPRGYPWKFDPYLGTKVFDRHDAPSLADQNTVDLARHIPLRLREAFAEWVIRQHLPTRLVSTIARISDRLLDGR